MNTVLSAIAKFVMIATALIIIKWLIDLVDDLDPIRIKYILSYILILLLGIIAWISVAYIWVMNVEGFIEKKFKKKPKAKKVEDPKEVKSKLMLNSMTEEQLNKLNNTYKNINDGRINH